jgi:hypothetical protein
MGLERVEDIVWRELGYAYGMLAVQYGGYRIVCKALGWDRKIA